MSGAPAGYSGTPLERKLGLKPDHVVFLDRPPAGFALDAPTVGRLPRLADVTLTFHTAIGTLERRFPVLVEHTVGNGMIWVCWPKKAAQQALAAAGTPVDIDEHRVRALGLRDGMVDVKVAAIDETWSGLKFVRRLADR